MGMDKDRAQRRVVFKRHESAFDFEAYATCVRRQQAEFEAEYPFIYAMEKSVDEHDLEPWLRTMFSAMIEYDDRHHEITLWAEHNLSHYKISNGRIGIKDPDEAFWFKINFY